MRVVFMGTPAFAATILDDLVQHHDVVAVYTRPDAVRGRGKRLEPSPVKVVAERHGLAVLTPRTLRDEEAQRELAAFRPDVICVAAYGAILPKEVLDIPRFGCLNVHASLLPRWRGAAPIQWAVIAGDEMAGVTDLPFRLLCKEQGAGLLCMEMVSAKAILYNNKNTEALMAIDDREPPVSLQLFGSDPDVISEMAKRIEERPFSILDINMGCPVPKVTGNGEGSALMKNPKLVEEIITKTARAIRKPVTVKIRKGFDESHVNAVEIAKIAEASGAAAVAVHGRTREQYYSGKADWDIIRQVKEAVKIPVIGNGDVTSAESADAIMRETGCDGVMIGRGAQGNPWIFHQILHWMETGEHEAKPTLEEVKQMILKHAALLVQEKGVYTGMREMRKHVAWYTTGYPHSAKLRARVNEITSLEELTGLLEQL